VPSSRSDRERSLGGVLPDHIIKALVVHAVIEGWGREKRRLLLSSQNSDDLRQISHTDDANPTHHGRLRSTHLRHYDRRKIALRGGNSVSRNSGRCLHLSREGELTAQRDTAQRRLRHSTKGAGKRYRDRKVEGRALFFDFGGSEIYQDILSGIKPTVLQGRDDSIARLSNRGTPKSEDRKLPLTTPDGELNFDGNGIETDDAA
jgi:hypothetical protein